MALDEFGREIPGLSSSSLVYSSSSHGHNPTGESRLLSDDDNDDDDRHFRNTKAESESADANLNLNEGPNSSRGSRDGMNIHRTRDRDRSESPSLSLTVRRRLPDSWSRSRSRSPDHHHPSHTSHYDYEYSSSSRDRDDRDRDRDGRVSRDRKPRSYSRDYHHRANAGSTGSRRHHGHDAHSHYDRNHYRKSSRDSRDRDRRSTSARDRDRDGHGHGHPHHYHREHGKYHPIGGGRRERGDGPGSSTKRRKAPHCELYVQEPMLCRQMWEAEQKEDAQMETDSQTYRDTHNQQELDVDGNTDANTNTTTIANVDGETNTVEETPKERGEDVQMENKTTSNATYEEYVQKYCLNYVRTFFNNHLDDQWFRQRYSPLEYRRVVEQERNRAKKEAHTITQEIVSPGEMTRKYKEGQQQGKDIHPFIVQARLGGGVKPNSGINATTEYHHGSHHHNLSTTRKRKYNSTSDAPLLHHSSTLINIDSNIPKSHLLSFVKQNKILQIMDIPSYVNDKQLLLAIREHCHHPTNNANGASTTASDGAASNNSPIIGNIYPIEIYSLPIIEGCCQSIRESFFNDDNGNTEEDCSDAISLIVGECSSVNSTFKQNDRHAWVVFESEAAKDKMLDNLFRANMDANRHIRDTRDRDIPKVLELEIDCSDPYGRYDIDADGHGAAPSTATDASDEDATTPAVKDSSSVTTKIPSRRVIIYLSTSPPVHEQQTVVLSAAVSSTKRIEKDCKTALTIAKRLDIVRNIPNDVGLVSILQKLFPNDFHRSYIQSAIEDQEFDNSTIVENKEDIEDILDVTIAYLRRVHLFTFYNGCSLANNLGSVLSGNHPVGTIHLRLKGADEILKKAREENADMYGDLPMGSEKDEKMNESTENVDDLEKSNADDENTKSDSVAQSTETKDMLVMRLDDSIEKVLKPITSAMEISNSFVVNQTVDTMAQEIKEMEEKTKNDWIDNHAVIDNDGRARCSFHFCNKLFKDKSFLKKHLLKKHSEFLKAEIAKCHDSYMMNWWDKEEIRPVPEVCVDCGPKFGLMMSSVTGAANPAANDPEPELWKEEQDRIRKIEEEERYKEKIAIEADTMEAQRKNSGNFSSNNAGPHHHHHHHGGDIIPNNNFVDVDDMKEEKVELSFENVNVVAPSSKKKKKKKKRLL